MLIHAKGDLLAMAAAGEFQMIIHGCNCQNDMGGGIAAQIAKLYPEAVKADQMINDYLVDVEKLGNWTESIVSDKSTWTNERGAQAHWFKIINAYTQHMGGAGTFSYTALQLILDKLAMSEPTAKYGLPYIGCGIAGGDQNIIVDMIEKFAIKVAATGGSVTLVEFGV